MQQLSTWKQFVYGFVNFRDCWVALTDIDYSDIEDFWEWLSTGYYDMYVYPYKNYDPWNLTGRDPMQSIFKK